MKTLFKLTVVVILAIVVGVTLGVIGSMPMIQSLQNDNAALAAQLPNPQYDDGCTVYFDWTDATNPIDFVPAIAERGRKECIKRGDWQKPVEKKSKVSGTFTVTGTLRGAAIAPVIMHDGHSVFGGSRSFDFNYTDCGDSIGVRASLSDGLLKTYGPNAFLDMGKKYVVTFSVSDRWVQWGSGFASCSNYRQFVSLFGEATSIVPLDR